MIIIKTSNLNEELSAHVLHYSIDSSLCVVDVEDHELAENVIEDFEVESLLETDLWNFNK